MRRSDHPSRPSAMTCCFFSSLKTLLTLTEGNPHVRLNVLGSTPLAGFQVILIGRFWVIPEDRGICFRSTSNSGGFNRSGFDTVFAHHTSRMATSLPLDSM